MGEVGAGAVVTGCVIGAGASVAAGERLDGGPAARPRVDVMS